MQDENTRRLTNVTASPPTAADFLSIAEVALRWRCSRGTVYNRLRSVGAKVLDFAPLGKRGKKVISTEAILQIEAKRTRRLC
jgi:hypothetical protein